jgi:hypothetical protein
MIGDAGFVIERCARFVFRVPPLDPPKTHLLGTARKSDAAVRLPNLSRRADSNTYS